MSQITTLKVRLTLFCILVGIVLATVAVVTDHWAVLSPQVEHHSAVCEAAHFGLWRICTKSIIVSGSKDKSCGPITLPGGNVATLSPVPAFCPALFLREKWLRTATCAQERGSELREAALVAMAVSLSLFLVLQGLGLLTQSRGLAM